MQLKLNRQPETLGDEQAAHEDGARDDGEDGDGAHRQTAPGARF